MANVLLDDLKRVFSPRGNGLAQLIIINLVVFIVVTIFRSYAQNSSGGFPLWLYLMLPGSFVDMLYQPWTYITYMFTHAEFSHIFWNMLMLFFLGRMFQEYQGTRKLVVVYILGGLFGGILYQLVELVGVAMNLDGHIFSDNGMLLGASGSVMAVVLALGTLIPNNYVQLFLFGRVQIKWLVLIIFVWTTVIDFFSNTGGNVAHVGGAIAGYLYIMQMNNGRNLGQPIDWVLNRFGTARPSTQMKPKARMRVVKNQAKPRSDYDYNEQKQWDQRTTDAILDKISKSGYDSLSKEEKEYLFHISQKRK